jgi:hypothetical protein
VDFLAFRPEQIEIAIEAFGGRVGQYVFISSTSAYEKPVVRHVITEDTPLRNPFWEYARQKIACEERLGRARLDSGFPVTVRIDVRDHNGTLLGSARTTQPCAYLLTDILPPRDSFDHRGGFTVGLVGLLGQEGALRPSHHERRGADLA